MRRLAKSLIAAVILAGFLLGCRPSPEPAQSVSSQPDTPFKLAQYQVGESRRLAMVVGGQLYDLHQLNASLPPADPNVLPEDMLGLIAGYSDLKPRLYQLANYADQRRDLAPVDLSNGNARLLAPILYPWNLLAVAVNYRRHGAEMGRELEESYKLDAPYVFAKSPKASIIADGEAVVLPQGRDRIDWEVELATVIGSKAKNVPPGQARDYIFGYTLMLDISDRGGRPRSDPQFNADWFSSKSQDRFAPLGPYIVPAEFVPDPHKLAIRLAVNGEVMQDSNTSFMIHGVYDLVSYVSSIQTLEPGDVISTGTPPGVGAGRKPPRFLKSGDVITAEIEGICSIRTPVK